MKITNIFGEGSQVKILDYLLLIQRDVCVNDVMKEANVSRKTADVTLEKFLKLQFIIKTRMIGNTQMYLINNHDTIVKKLKEIKRG